MPMAVRAMGSFLLRLSALSIQRRLALASFETRAWARSKTVLLGALAWRSLTMPSQSAASSFLRPFQMRA